MKTAVTFSLLAFLPALTFAFFLPFPMNFETTNVNEIPKVTPEDVCPFIHYIDNDLCTNESSRYATKEVVKNAVFYHPRSEGREQKFDPTQLCPLLSYLNKTYCSSSETANFVSQIDDDTANRIKTIKQNFEKIKINIKNKTPDSGSDSYFSEQIDPKELCPLIELVDKTFCKSETLFQNKIDPKDLCPILELIDAKLCS
jgi:hypothetical protein